MGKRPTVWAQLWRAFFVSLLTTLIIYAVYSRSFLNSKRDLLLRLWSTSPVITMRTAYTRQGVACPLVGMLNVTAFSVQNPFVGASSVEWEILGTLSQRLGSRVSFLKEMLNGAHVVVRGDKGSFYRWLGKHPLAYGRISSHFSNDEQKAIDLHAYLKTLLTGTTMEGDSWLQFEGASWNPLQDPLEVFSLSFLSFLSFSSLTFLLSPFFFSPRCMQSSSSSTRCLTDR